MEETEDESRGKKMERNTERERERAATYPREGEGY